MNTRTVSRRALAVLILGICLGSGVASIAQSAVTNQPIALSGQPAPGGGAGETFLGFGDVIPVINSRGDVAFVCTVTNSGSAVNVLFLHRNGDLELERVAEQGKPVPNQVNLNFGAMSSLAINDLGEVMFNNVADHESSLLCNVGGTWRVLARTGAQAPGSPAGTIFFTVGDSLSFDNQPFAFRSRGGLGAAFAARTTIANVAESQKEGLWVVNPSATDPFPHPFRLLEYGGPAPDLTEGETLIENALFSVALGSRVLAFDGQIAGPGVNPTNDLVLWAGPPAAPKVIARSGQRAPTSFSDQFYRGFRRLGVNGAGELCFVADLSTTQVLFTGTPNSLTPVVRTGENLPGGGSFQSIDSNVIDGAGQVGFMATVSLGILGSYPGIFRWSPNTGLKPVALVGGACPGAPAGWTFQDLGPWNLNWYGRVAFYGVARSPNGLVIGKGWWITDANGTPVLLAQSGIPQPADPLGVLEAEGQLSPVGFLEISGGEDGRRRFLGDFNHVVFAAELAGGQSGIFRSLIEGDYTPPSEEFFLTVEPDPVFAKIQPAGFLDGHLTNGAYPGQWAYLRVLNLHKDWNHGKVRLEITVNADTRDLLGIGPPSALEGDDDITMDGSKVVFKGDSIGEVSRPANNVLEATLTSDATTKGVEALLHSLAYGFAENVENLLRANPRFSETNRVLRLSVSDAGGRTGEALIQVVFPRTEGLALSKIGPENKWVELIDTPVSLELLLRLSDTSRVSLPDRRSLPLGTEKWSSPDPITNGTIIVWQDKPAADINRTVPFGTPIHVVVSLYGWEANGEITWQTPDDEFDDPNCLVDLFWFFYKSLGAKETSTHQISSTVTGRQPAGRRQNSFTNAAGAIDFLAGPYALRKWMNQSPEGRRLVALYEQHSPELVRIVLTNSTLLNDAAGTMSEFLPGLSQFLSARGEDRVIRPDMIQQLNRVWDAFEAAGSPGLKATLAAERTRFHGFQAFAGRTFGDWGQLLAIGVPASPFIMLSSPQRTNQIFTAEANRVEGLAYSLQRTPPVSPLNWTDVGNSVIRLFDYRVELTDTNTFGESLMYRLRATEIPASR